MYQGKETHGETRTDTSLVDESKVLGQTCTVEVFRKGRGKDGGKGQEGPLSFPGTHTGHLYRLNMGDHVTTGEILVR